MEADIHIQEHDLTYRVDYNIGKCQEEVTYNEDYSGSPHMCGDIELIGVWIEDIDIYQMVVSTCLERILINKIKEKFCN